MKISRKVSPTTMIEATGETVADVFEAVARAEEIFSGHDKCGCCGTDGAHLAVNNDKEGNTYYKMRCVNKDCRAEFRFGQLREPKGSLFPQLKDKEGNWKKNGGWEIYQAQTGTATNKPAARQEEESEDDIEF